MVSRDERLDVEAKESELKNDVFIHNPQLYNQLFGEESKYLSDEEVEHVVPESESDFNKLMRELKQVGVID